MLALDMARIEAGLLLIDVDFQSSRKALIETQKYSPYELNLGRLVDLKKGPFVGRAALNEEVKRASRARLSASSSIGPSVERLYEAVGLPPDGSRGHVTRGRAGLQRSTTGGPRHVDDVVHDPQEVHRAGHA